MAQFESENTRSMATNLVQLQIMLLMAIEADSYGPASSRAYGSSKSFWLSSAVGLAYSMKLHVTRTVENPTDPEADFDDLLGRRIWWTLVIIDRWHASSTASPLLIPETSVVVLPDDQVILGDNIYHFSRKYPRLLANLLIDISRPLYHLGSLGNYHRCTWRPNTTKLFILIFDIYFTHR